MYQQNDKTIEIMVLIKTKDWGFSKENFYNLGEINEGGWSHKILHISELDSGLCTKEWFRGHIYYDRCGDLKIELGHKYYSKIYWKK